MIKRGDIIEFKGEGPTFFFLGWILKLFERWWDRWGWHTAFVCGKDERGLDGYPYRIYRWLDRVPPQAKVDAYVESVLGARYDVAIYFWTTAQYLFRHFFNRRIPRLLDDRYTCWENVFWFMREVGKPIQSIYDCPMITDMLKVVRFVEEYPGGARARKPRDTVEFRACRV